MLYFNQPIVATNFTGALEQLQDRENGVVVGMSAEDIAKGVMSAMDKGPIDRFQVQTHNDLSKLLELLQ